MKSIFSCIVICIISSIILTDSSFYNIVFESIDGVKINTSSYKGKKVIIAIVSADTANRKLVHYLDSAQNANDSLRVIAIPTGDFQGDVSTQALKDIKRQLGIAIAKPMKVTKGSGAQQHPLFSWLTNSSENSHFNMDVSGEGQLFFISPKGTLYGVLPKETPLRIISKVINQSFAE